MLQLLYQRMPMRTEQVSEKPDEILEENFFFMNDIPANGIGDPLGLCMLRRED